MDQNQRVSLATPLKNLKQNRLFIVTVLGLITLAGLYLGYPLTVLKTSSNAIEEYDLLSAFYTSPLNVTKVDEDTLPPKGKLVKWGFDSTKSTACKEENVYSLGVGVYLSICNYKNHTVVDIRKFTGNSRIGITPTIVGIGLNIDQWAKIKTYTNIIDQTVRDLSNL